ncbi:MAG: HD domain-containing protein [Bacteroidota bacterium]
MVQEIYQRAMKYAGEKHHAQMVPGSKANYLLHISNVAMEVLLAYGYDSSFDLTFAIQVAILHDTLEDTEATYKELKQNFGVEIANGVLALTKDESIAQNDRMNDSLNRINKERDEVGIVKLSDRITNLQMPPSYWTKEKIRSYLNDSIDISTRLAGKNRYLNNRLLRKIEEYHKLYC